MTAIRELYRVTAKRLIVTVPRENGELQQFGLAFATYTDLTHLRYYSLDQFRVLLSTVPHSSINIEEEVAIDFRSLAANTLTVRLPVPGFSWFGTKILRSLVRHCDQKKMCAGLVGVVDLA